MMLRLMILNKNFINSKTKEVTQDQEKRRI